MANKYHSLYKGFQKLFQASRSSSTPKNLRGNISTTIVGVKPNVPKTATEKAKSKLKIATQKTKASQAKLDQTIFNLQEQNRAFKKAREKKMGGGMMGRRFGMKAGTPKLKTNIQKIKETFGLKKKLSPKQMKIAKQAGDPNRIDAPDFKKLRGKA
jgi:hypothetical protein